MIGLEPICMNCKHFHRDKRSEKLTCDAFPYEIPGEIIMNGFDHHKPHKLDSGILYEAIREVNPEIDSVRHYYKLPLFNQKSEEVKKTEMDPEAFAPNRLPHDKSKEEEKSEKEAYGEKSDVDGFDYKEPEGKEDRK